MLFINLSNHNSKGWNPNQKMQAMRVCDKIVDVGFPNVSPKATKDDVIALASEYVNKVSELMGTDPFAEILVQGEMTFVVNFVNLIKVKYPGVRCVAATTERVVVETPNSDGTVTKTSRFEFVQFREY